jgi:GNAT superfamily N-acetyltransferase
VTAVTDEQPTLDRIRVNDRDADVCFGVVQDAFFKRHALDNDRRQISRCYVLRHPSGRVLGFFTLSMADVDTSTFDLKLRRGLPKYPMPVALIGQLAVDVRERGHGFGDLLVQHAFEKILAAAEIIA